MSRTSAASSRQLIPADWKIEVGDAYKEPELFIDYGDREQLGVHRCHEG
jgi:hypothetical protein